MKKYSEEKEKIISQWGKPRILEKNWKKSKYIEYGFSRINKGIRYTTLHTKIIWVYEDIIFNRKKDMIAYINNEEVK